MKTIVISGVRPYDGRYEFDRERQFTAREWGWIKRLSGYLPPLGDDALRDPEFSVVIALIALHRAGKIATGDVPQMFEKFADAPDLTLETEDDDVEVEEELEPVDPTSPRNSSSRTGSSGADTSTSSADPTELPRSNGSPSSAISESDPATSAI